MVVLQILLANAKQLALLECLLGYKTYLQFLDEHLDFYAS